MDLVGLSLIITLLELIQNCSFRLNTRISKNASPCIFHFILWKYLISWNVPPGLSDNNWYRSLTSIYLCSIYPLNTHYTCCSKLTHFPPLPSKAKSPGRTSVLKCSFRFVRVTTIHSSSILLSACGHFQAAILWVRQSPSPSLPSAAQFLAPCNTAS